MRHHLQFIRAVFTAVVLFSLAAVAAGQEVSGSISGKIKDANGADVTKTVKFTAAGEVHRLWIELTGTTATCGAFSITA